MLNIFLYEQNKPKKDYVHDAEGFIYKVGIPDNEVSKLIISQIDKASYLNIYEFTDRFGYKLPMSFLSTGSKILLEIANSSRVINGLEMGQNAFDLMLQSLDGNVYFDSVDRFELPDSINISRISVNGKVYSNLLELENALWNE